MWLLLLVVTAFANRDMRTTDVREYMPSFVPVLVGVVLIIRLVWADHPSSSDTASLTRPIGRGALWLGKITLLLLAGVLPWCLAEFARQRNQQIPVLRQRQAIDVSVGLHHS